MKLTQYEQETIVNFNEADSVATVYTYNSAFKKKLRLLSGQFPADAKFIREDQHGGVTYSIPKRWIKIQAPRMLTEEQRIASAERLRSNLGRVRP